MDRRISMALFIATFLLIYGAVHLYVVLRLAHFFGYTANTPLYLLVVGLTALYLVSASIEKRWSSKATRALYFVACVEMGTVFLFLSTLVVFEILGLVIPFPPALKGWLIVIIAAALSLSAYIKARFVHVKSIVVPMHGLKKAVRAVQLSDLHVGSFKRDGFLDKIVERVNALDPDVVFITGDLFDATAPLTDKILKPLNKLKAPAFYVIGNHEVYEGLDNVYYLLSKTKVKVLRDKVVSFKGLQITGLEYAEEKKETLKALRNLKIPMKSPSVLLHHVPLPFDVLDKAGIDLQLAGHTHHGQVAPFNLLVALAHPHTEGLTFSNKSARYVSPGTSTWGPPMRLGSSNEITLIILKPKK